MEIQKSGSSVSLKFFALSDAKRIRTLSPITKKNFLRWAGLKKNDHNKNISGPQSPPQMKESPARYINCAPVPTHAQPIDINKPIRGAFVVDSG